MQTDAKDDDQMVLVWDTLQTEWSKDSVKIYTRGKASKVRERCQGHDNGQKRSEIWKR